MKSILLLMMLSVLVLALLLSACSGEKAGEAVKLVRTDVDNAPAAVTDSDKIAIPQVSVGGVPLEPEDFEVNGQQSHDIAIPQ